MESLPAKVNLAKKFVVIPMLIPGSGKSSLAETLSKSSTYSWRIVDTDKIRRKIMEDIDEVNLNSDKSQ